MATGGKYLVDKLRDDGLHTAKVQDIVRVWIGEVHFAAPGTALAHPRASDPIVEALVESLMQGFRAEEPIIVRDAGMVKGKRRLEIIDGAQRKINGTEAEKRLNAAGKLAKTDGRYMVAVRLFDGDDLACLMERERCQSDNLKRPHAPSVLYASYAAMEKLGATREQIASVAPRDCDVSAILRWPALDAVVQRRLDAGDAPMTVIAALLDVPRSDQAGVLDRIIAQKATTPRKAQRVVKAATGGEVEQKARPPTIPALTAMSSALNGETGKLRDLLAYLAGGEHGLSAVVVAKLDEARKGVKPGVKPGKASA